MTPGLREGWAKRISRGGTTMISRRQLVHLSAASALAQPTLGLFGRAALAQAWPNRHVRLIVPFPPGGGADTIAPHRAPPPPARWGQQVGIENKGGAGGNLAAEATARSAPDGYTIFLAGDFQATNIFLTPKLSYDPVADFAPVSLVVLYPIVMVVPNSSPSHSIRDFIAH